MAVELHEAGAEDGIDNDGDGKIDFDGGVSVLGYLATDPDTQCTDPWQMVEAFRGSVRASITSEIHSPWVR